MRDNRKLSLLISQASTQTQQQHSQAPEPSTSIDCALLRPLQFINLNPLYAIPIIPATWFRAIWLYSPIRQAVSCIQNQLHLVNLLMAHG
jgi:hypothetical protein